MTIEEKLKADWFDTVFDEDFCRSIFSKGNALPFAEVATIRRNTKLKEENKKLRKAIESHNNSSIIGRMSRIIIDQDENNKNSIMKTILSIDASTARELYNAGCGAVKTILEKSFGKGFFKGDITCRVKTYEDALHILGVEDFLTISVGVSTSNTLNRLFPPHVIAYIKLYTIIEALNEGWEPNWDDADQAKYYPFFFMSPSSFAFCDSTYDYSNANAGCGSRFCLKSKELSNYCGTQFFDLWKEFMLK